MKSLAIVSSYNELCGNATYTHALKKEFGKHFQVDVLPLKTRLLRHKAAELARAGDEHMDELAIQLRKYDYVNIQFEAGLYGIRPKNVFGRVAKLINASNNLVFTMHRIDYGITPAWWEFCKTFNPIKPRKSAKNFLRRREISDLAWLCSVLVKELKRSSLRKNAWLLLHTRRDSEMLRILHGFDRIIDYPLTYLSPQEQNQYQKVDLQPFHAKYNLPADAKAIGVFGFINRYKGFDTVIKSLPFLPPDHHLLIFGAQHPLNIRENQSIEKYLRFLLDLTVKLSVQNRVHFIGAVDDESFLNALSCCHRVVLPYLEVGQGMSAIAELALELRAKALYANNLSVRELNRYAPDAFQTFDIGNHLELAEKIQNYHFGYGDAIDRYTAKYNLAGNIQMQIGLFEGRAPVAAPAPFERKVA